MIGFWTPIWHRIRSVFILWGQTLDSSAPNWLRKHLHFSNSPARIELNSLKDLEACRFHAGSDLDIVLSHELAIVHHSKFPITAAPELDKVVPLEAARVMPLESSQLSIAYEVTSKSEDRGIEVILVAARRRIIDQIWVLAGKAGITVRHVSVAVDGRDVPFRLAQLRSLKLKRFAGLAGAVAILFLVAVQVPKIYLDRLNAAITETDEAIRLARKNTAKIATLQKQVDSLQGLSSAVQSIKDENQTLELMSVLTAISPDTVRIDEMRIDGRRLYLSGRAASPEDWVIQLQKNSAFDDVRLTSVYGQSDEPTRRFEVHLRVMWPQERLPQ